MSRSKQITEWVAVPSIFVIWNIIADFKQHVMAKSRGIIYQLHGIKLLLLLFHRIICRQFVIPNESYDRDVRNKSNKLRQSLNPGARAHNRMVGRTTS